MDEAPVHCPKCKSSKLYRDCLRYTPEGLSAFLGSTRRQLIDLSGKNVDSNSEIPDVADWVVVQWHYGKDDAREISGPSFNVTFNTWFDQVARIYIRKTNRQSKPRLEILDRPRKTLAEAFADKIQPSLNR